MTFFNDPESGRRFVENVVEESPLATGMEPSREAREAARNGPAALCGGVGLLAGGVLGAASAWGLCALHGVPVVPFDGAVRWSFVFGAILGWALWSTLRGFADAFRILPRWTNLAVGAGFGAAAGGVALLVPGAPSPDSFLVAILAGLGLASLFRALERWLP